MKALRIICCLALLNCLGTDVNGEDQKGPFVESAAGKGDTGKDAPVVSREPDHLVPIDPRPEDWHKRYTDILRAQLKLDAPFFARMVTEPSFEGESCLRLHGEEGCSDISRSKKFFLTYYEADKSIWDAMPEHSNDKEKSAVTVSVLTAPISAALAWRLRGIWDKMLSRTRPPEKVNTVFDGVSFEFATPERSAQAQNPSERKSPTLFVELGRSLISYCQATPGGRPIRLTSIEAHATNLEAYLAEHPTK